MRTFIAFLLALLVASSAAQAGVLQGVAPLKESEMAELCGGFTLPNGINLNVGIDNHISLNGTTIASSSLSLNGNTFSTSSTGTTQVVGNGGVTTVQFPSVGTALITNTASNVTLDQVRTITVDLSNVTKQNLQTMSNFSLLQSQALNSFKNGLH